ncbi:TlpA family protein disulfide reductase [Rhabdothermincola salaria]|uniref:TlpA family protein disulfide reductase n=1 Tax=Rhabdothermincola salaria TaxID=2903142 RepID=UPI001E5253DE|nr:TlpA disulfide reductase family protein [Rhabdothermincola salaria]MCD9624907.1 TlpA family protein disulfide reductase [Rhabdothermincola salaria]
MTDQRSANRSNRRTDRGALVAAVAVVVVLVGAACGGSTDDAGSDTPASDTTAAPSTTTAAGATGADPTSPTTAGTPMAELEPWQTIEITDVDGATFTLGDFAGTPVFVENFATWCSTCRSQLGTTQAAAASLGDEAVFVVLSVETSLSPAEVADYAEDNGFTDMRFAVMTPELLAAFVEAFGNSAVNPPSTPHVVIGPSGAAGEMSTGSIGEADIVDALRSAV